LASWHIPAFRWALAFRRILAFRWRPPPFRRFLASRRILVAQSADSSSAAASQPNS
ncbi:hypothetical protein KFL_003750165, partial [Klebsormidium nitens]